MEAKKMNYSIALNISKKTYTIRVTDKNGKLMKKYRSYPQGSEFSKNWTENDIMNFLFHSDDYYVVK